MADSYQINVSGPDAKTVVIPPVNGIDGTPLGPAGNGKDGVAGKFDHTCEQQATPGLPGNFGTGAPPADSGASGANAFNVTITCSEYSGGTLMLLNNGGAGADGNSGGKGGSGSDGGNAGKQPAKACTDVIAGGTGGNAGRGGAAGKAGDGGNAGDIAVVYGPGFSDNPVSAISNGGKAGMYGQPGLPGTPGKGGMGSDGTQASSGAAAGGGASGGGGKGGYGGSFEANPDKKMPGTYLKISVMAHTGS